MPSQAASVGGQRLDHSESEPANSGQLANNPGVGPTRDTGIPAPVDYVERARTLSLL